MPAPFRSTIFSGGSFAASGSNGHGSAGLLIYSASRASSGLLPTADLSAIGKDVFVFVSGTIGSRGTTTPGTVLLAGDTYTSGSTYSAGTFYGKNGSFAGDLTVDGTLYATEFKTTIVSASIIYRSGSTRFGDSADDTHTFTGAITGSDLRLSGDLAVNGGDITSTALSPTLFNTSDNNDIEIGRYLTAITLAGQATSNPLTVSVGASRSGNFTLNMGSAAATGATKTVNIATNAGAGSVTNITLGSNTAGTSGTTFLKTPTVEIYGRAQVTGSLVAPFITGSLTRLVDGTSYLAAGTNVTIVTGSTGQITISSTGGGGSASPSYWTEGGASRIYATGSVAINQAGSAQVSGSDQIFYVKGTVGGKSPFVNAGVSTIDGDAVISGTLYINSIYGLNGGSLDLAGTTYTQAGQFKTAGNVSTVRILAEYETSEFKVFSDDGFGPYNHLRVFDMDGMGQTRIDIGNEFSPTLSRLNITGSGEITQDFSAKLGLSGSLTRLSDGRSYMVAGSNVTINSASNGQVTISSTGGSGSPGGSDTFVQFNDGGSFNGTGGLTFNKATGTLQVTGSLIASSSAGVFVLDGTQPTVTVRASTDATNQAVFYQEIGGDTYISNQKNSGKFFSSVKTSAGVAVRYLRAIPNAVNYNTIVSFVQGLHDFFDPQTNSTDVNFFVGGKPGSKDTAGQRGTALFAGDLVVSGSTHLQGGGSVTGSISIQGSIVPSADSTYTLGTSAQRWGHVYTGDLHLRNERGDWTILEEPDYLCVINNKTGKKFKMMLQPLD